MSDSLKQQLNKQLSQLKAERLSFESHWRELSDFTRPRSTRFTASEVNRGDRRNSKIIDPAAVMAARTLSSGMMSGITSPARPWFRLATPDRDLMDYGPVKLWLETVEQRMNEVFNRSNLYQSLPLMYEDLGTFATGAMAVVADPQRVIRTVPFPTGSFYIANGADLSVDTAVREFSMTVRQVITEFGMDAVSDTVKSQWNSGQYGQWVDVVHAVYPNLDRQTGKLEAKHKAYKSVYYEATSTDDKLLRESGYDEFPIMAPRWEVNGEDVYGSSCPGMVALGSVKALQLLQRRKAQMIDKITNPPLQAPASIKSQRISTIPGGINYLPMADVNNQIKPLFQIPANGTNGLLEDIQDTRQIIDHAYFVDLFRMMQTVNTRSMPVEAVAEMREEKLLMLGPVLQRLDSELLDKLINRTFSVMAENNLLPVPPDEMQGMQLKVEYISVMAQAQKAIGVSSIERFIGFTSGIGQFSPDALDKINVDETIDAYAASIGVPPSVVATNEQVAQIREQRAQQQAMAQQMQMAQAAVGGAQALGNTPMDDNSALAALTGGGQ
ncbi:phage tail protein [Morganella morganii subsp. morganii]|uniref:portal protein n=1 Tax=Morganella morganii TaxID=582 RepID=UPI0006628357|nr:portal protein [Morganella morganii]AVD60294.1 phage tail protein [Morganella morganii]MBT0429703.1 phage tail protein [Morganella morganii subsp. morganii]MBT0477361.1 phage tail protein [Morganella morganii subsp. morganii]MBT0524440.1 phage tail protein [Morganella morganii subsp. morganii]MCW3199548.1 portal protein [Morganella morganii]